MCQLAHSGTCYASHRNNTEDTTIHTFLHEPADGDLQTVTYGPITERARLTAASASLLLIVGILAYNRTFGTGRDSDVGHADSSQVH